MINGIIFDMDGLMFDTERVFFDAWDYAGEKIGVGKAGYMVTKTLGMSLCMTYDLWREEFGDKYDEVALRRYSKEFLAGYYEQNRVPVKPGLYELLTFLSENGYKMCVASSSPEWEVRHHLEDAGVAHYFAAVVCGDMVENGKPDAEIYLKACDAISERPCDCLALEDSQSGILSAFRAGCKAVMVPDLWEADEQTETILYAKVENLSEVIGVLKNIGLPHKRSCFRYCGLDPQ